MGFDGRMKVLISQKKNPKMIHILHPDPVYMLFSMFYLTNVLFWSW